MIKQVDTPRKSSSGHHRPTCPNVKITLARKLGLAALCADLTATETVYPGTNLKIVYSVKGYT